MEHRTQDLRRYGWAVGTIDNDTLTIWATGYTDADFSRFMQYLINSSSDPEKFVVINPATGTAYKAATLYRAKFSQDGGRVA